MPIRRLGHIGIYVDDLPRMERFYTDVLGLTVTDHDEGGVFLSSRPGKVHHEMVLINGRTDHSDGRLINQISWMCESLEDLKGFKERLSSSDAVFHEIVTHGIAVGIYFYDPEGNRTEVFCATGIENVRQPYKRAVNIDQPDDDILRDLDRLHHADGITASLA